MSLYYFFKVSIVSLSVYYVTALSSASIVPSSVCYATIIIISSRFYCSVICLLRHYSVLGFGCLLFYLLRQQRHYYFFKVSIVSLSVYYVTALSSASIVPSSVCYATILFLQVSIVSLSVCFHCTVLGFVVPSSDCYDTI